MEDIFKSINWDALLVETNQECIDKVRNTLKMEFAELSHDDVENFAIVTRRFVIKFISANEKPTESKATTLKRALFHLFTDVYGMNHQNMKVLGEMMLCNAEDKNAVLCQLLREFSSEGEFLPLPDDNESILYMKHICIHAICTPLEAVSRDFEDFIYGRRFGSLYDLHKLKDVKDTPLRFRKYSQQILKVKAYPTRDRNVATFMFATGFAPVSLMGATLNRSESLSKPTKFIMAAAPVIIGSIGRFWCGKMTDKDGGRKASLQLLAMGIIGVICLAIVVATIGENNLAIKVTEGSVEMIMITLAGLIVGGGVATLPSSMAMAARSGPGDEAAKRQGFAGGLGNISSGIFLIVTAPVVVSCGLVNTYILWTGISLICFAIIWKYLYNSVFHQLCVDQDVPRACAKDIAIWMGQEMLPDIRVTSYTYDIKHLTYLEKKAVILMSCNYIVTVGGFLAITSSLAVYFKEQCGQRPGISLFYAGIFSIVASLSRYFAGMSPLEKRGRLSTNLGLFLFGIGMAAIIPAPPFVIILILIFVAVGPGDGIGNYGIFRWITEILGHKIGSVAGIVGGVGAMGGPVISTIIGSMSTLNETDPNNDEIQLTAFQFLVFPIISFACILANCVLKFPKTEDGQLCTEYKAKKKEVEDVVPEVYVSNPPDKISDMLHNYPTNCPQENEKSGEDICDSDDSEMTRVETTTKNQSVEV